MQIKMNEPFTGLDLFYPMMMMSENYESAYFIRIPGTLDHHHITAQGFHPFTRPRNLLMAQKNVWSSQRA